MLSKETTTMAILRPTGASTYCRITIGSYSLAISLEHEGLHRQNSHRLRLICYGSGLIVLEGHRATLYFSTCFIPSFRLYSRAVLTTSGRERSRISSSDNADIESVSSRSLGSVPDSITNSRTSQHKVIGSVGNATCCLESCLDTNYMYRRSDKM